MARVTALIAALVTLLSLGPALGAPASAHSPGLAQSRAKAGDDAEKARAAKAKADKTKAAKAKADKAKAAKAAAEHAAKVKADKTKADRGKADKGKADKGKADKGKADQDKSSKLDHGDKPAPVPAGDHGDHGDDADGAGTVHASTHAGPDGPPSSGFVAEKPAPETQTQKSAKERGINPCLTPDLGWGIYDHWDRSPTIGQMIMPGRGGLTKDGGFDVMFHFHGHEAVRKEWVQVMDGAVLVGIDLGIGSGAYSGTFNNPSIFEHLLASVEAAVAKHTGRKSVHVRHVGLSAWSAGYGAVQEIISQPLGKKLVDTVILLDGLHCGYQGNSLNEGQIKPFVEFAQRAAHRQVLMFVSHSSIIPPGYASTTETANFLIYKVGGKNKKVHGHGPMGMDLIDRFSRGNFHVRGYAGNDKMDHCAHIGVLRDVLRVRVKPRWKTPKGRAAPSAPAAPSPAAPPAVPADVQHSAVSASDSDAHGGA